VSFGEGKANITWFEYTTKLCRVYYSYPRKSHR